MATTLNRRPLSNCSLQLGLAPSPSTYSTASTSKRPVSPNGSVVATSASKRLRLADPSSSHKSREKLRERKYTEREQQKAEFREKYTRAFPNFTFYFDELSMGAVPFDSYEEMIERLGAKAVRFLDKSVTHFISNRLDVASLACANDKENMHRKAPKSPIKRKGCEDQENGANASGLTYKIWNTNKLESVLTRCLEPPIGTIPSRSLTGKKQQLPSLARLLKSEQIHGTTERDPTQKRHDFKYFTRGAKFILIEDIRQELATIAAYEYPVLNPREDTTTKPPWPVLHCHPQARGPFIAFDERERRRWQKLQKMEEKHKLGREDNTSNIKLAEASKTRLEPTVRFKHNGDLRRSVSMNNLHRRATLAVPHKTGCILELDGEGGDLDSAIASGFLAAGNGGYMAASGNSVGITSTAGNTSTAGYSSRPLQLSMSFGGRIKHIVTSRKFISTTAEKENKPPPMGPPVEIPEKQPLLRKSRSTNTLKLPKREEGSKPGYCESCRVRFDNFQAHISGRKHQRFASDDANFLQLDCVLSRVRRRTKGCNTETLKKRQCRRLQCYSNPGILSATSSDEPEYPSSTD